MHSQRNCSVYKWEGDTCRYKACNYLENAPKYFQLRKEFHKVYDRALEICPNYSDAYRAKSVAYLKTGDFISWKKLMDKAVEINPIEHLGYRGWAKFQFFRDYKGAISDFEYLDSISDNDIGYSQNGTYHLNIAKALCYKMLDKKDIAISIIQKQIENDPFSIGIYDYLHLGVLYLENNKYEEALLTFKKQEQEYSCAENAYYSALVYKAIKDSINHKKSLLKSKDLYLKGRKMYDSYTHPVDKVYLKDIENLLE